MGLRTKLWVNDTVNVNIVKEKSRSRVGTIRFNMYLTFMELFKILKFDVPQSIKDLFKFCPRNEKLRLIVPLLRLDISQQNFLYTSTKIWNDLIPYVLKICDANEDGIIIPGSSKNSDLSA